ncbi:MULTISPECIES: hypothetical protein [unclassified Streptomyces]|uniref:hypothetical protein n=1 Tax=unclassified Streptomyces TaxID=2593676 RepID=UPI00342EA20B
MRAVRTVVAAVLGLALLTGCGPSDSDGGGAPSGDSGRPGASPSPSTSLTTSPSPSPTEGGPTASDGAPSPTASPADGRTPAPGGTLVRVTRTGGFAGRTHTLVVKDDGSWTRLGAKAEPQGTGRLTGAELAALRTALQKADFAALPRVTTGGPTIYDGFFYAFAHAGREVASDDGSLPPALAGVLEAMPPFTAD